MEIEYIMALITLMAVAVSFNSVQAVKAQTAASIAIADSQIKAQLVSANRQKWIEGLRSEMSDIISLTSLWARNQHIDDDLLHRTTRANILLITRLNPHNNAHTQLIADAKRLSQLATLIHSKRTPETATETAKEWNSLTDEMISHTQAILEVEREYIHRGE